MSQWSLVVGVFEDHPIPVLAFTIIAFLVFLTSYRFMIRPWLKKLKESADENTKTILAIKAGIDSSHKQLKDDLEKRHDESKTDAVGMIQQVEKSIERLLNTIVFTITSEIQKNHEANEKTHAILFQKVDALDSKTNEVNVRLTVMECK